MGEYNKLKASSVATELLGQIEGCISMGVQIGISRDCGIHGLLALPSLTMPQTSPFPKKFWPSCLAPF